MKLPNDISTVQAKKWPALDKRTAGEYLAYIAFVCAGVVLALNAIITSGQTVVSWLDDVRRPADARSLPTIQNVTFALLPAGIPADVKNAPSMDTY